MVIRPKPIRFPLESTQKTSPLAPRVGFEPTTGRLTAVSSATELSGNETVPAPRIELGTPCLQGRCSPN
jgi:hypothetical protein